METFPAALTIAQVKDHLLRQAMLLFGALSLPSLFVSAARTLDTGWHPMYTTHVVLACLNILAALLRNRLPRTALLPMAVLVPFVLGTATVTFAGFVGVGEVFFAVGAVLLTMQRGYRASLLYTLASGLALMLLAWLYQRGTLPQVAPPEDSVLSMFSHATVLSIVSFFLVHNVHHFVALLQESTQLNRAQQKALDDNKLIRIQGEARIQLVADTMPGMVYQYRLGKDMSQHFDFVSKGGEALLGLSREEIIADFNKVWDLVVPEDREALWASIKASAAEIGPWQHEFRVQTLHGKQIWLQGNANPSVDAPLSDGSLYWSGQFLDITARKNAEEALLESQSRYRSIVEDQTEMIVRWLPDGTRTFVNGAYCRSHKRTREDLLSGNLLHDADPAEQEQIIKTYEALSLESPTVTMTYRVMRHNVMHWQEWIDRGIFNPRGELQEIQSIGRDVTARKKTERQLLLTQTAVETNQGLLFWLAPAGDFVYLNPASRSNLGYSHQEFLDMSVLDLIPHMSELQWRKHLAQVFEDQHLTLETCYKRKDGTIFPVEMSLSLIDFDGSTYLFSSGIDLTQRKKQEKAIRESEERFRTMVSNLPGAVYRAHLDNLWTVHYISAAVEKITGYPSWHFRHDRIRSYRSLIHPQDAPGVRNAIEQSTLAQQPFDLEYRIYHASGDVRWVHEKGQVSPHDDPKEAHVDGAIFDITHRKRSEAAHRRLSIAVEQAKEAFAVTDEAGYIQYANPAITELLGYTEDQILGLHLPEVLFSSRDQDGLRLSIEEGKPWQGQRNPINLQTRTARALEVALSPIHDESNHLTGHVSVLRDVTREKILEGRLRQSQKMRAIGTLAGGIAHDFNNILTGIMGFAELAKLDATEQPQIRESIQEVISGATRARELVAQILAFSRKRDEERTLVQVEDVLNDVLKLLRATLPTTIAIRKKVHGPCRPIMGSTIQIHQILMNLGTNALRAMQRQGGTLTLQLQEIELDEAEASLLPETLPGRYLQLSVEDTGEGMDARTQERIFEPYFTTRIQGEGTGLGLTTVHHIVKSHRGSISCTSIPGEGTTFRVLLPCVAGHTEHEPPPPSLPRSPLEGHEVIALVDDEKAITRANSRSLQRLGYQTVTFSSALEALKWLSQNPAPDFLITDLTMPEMTGLQLARELQTLHPSLPVLLCTGFADEDTEREASRAGILEVLLKPVLPTVLISHIRRHLDAS